MVATAGKPKHSRKHSADMVSSFGHLCSNESNKLEKHCLIENGHGDYVGHCDGDDDDDDDEGDDDDGGG